MHCGICHRESGSGEEYTHLRLYVNGSEGLTVCSSCRIDLTGCARAMIAAANRTRLMIRKAEVLKRKGETDA